MITTIFTLFCFLVVVLTSVPEQVHLSSTGQREITVTWVSQNETSTSILYCGEFPGNYSQKVSGVQVPFSDLGPMNRKIFIHRAVLTNLIPHNTYYYVVGDGNAMSEEFNFVALADRGTSDELRLAVYGDMGVNNSRIVSWITNISQSHSIDAVLHVGDFAYDFNSNNALNGDDFMNLIEPIAAYSPYQVCPGNHEADYLSTFNNYRARFNTGATAMYFSFDIGLVHFVSISTEHYFFVPLVSEVPEQWKWLESDLAAVDRTHTPWVVVYGHRPMYCTDNDNDTITDCGSDTELVREGFVVEPGQPKQWGLESLLYKYGVEIYLCAHEHDYERTWPVFQSAVMNGSAEAPYTNQKATVHLLSGAAGNQERLDYWNAQNAASYSALHESAYGYGLLNVFNSTHIQWRQLRADDNSLLDEIWIVKDSHGPF